MENINSETTEKEIRKLNGEYIEEGRHIVPNEPKTFVFTVGVNGEPKLNIECDKEMSIKDMCTALATIDLANFNTFLKDYQGEGSKGLDEYIKFNTLRKQIFLEAVQKLLGTEDTEIIDFLADVI